MIKYYTVEDNKLHESHTRANDLKKVVWIDMLSPHVTEDHEIENLLDINVPSREEMHEIEVSSRLYSDNGALYITATIVTHEEPDEQEKSHAVTFIIKDNVLVTVRYSQPKAFTVYLNRITRNHHNEPIQDGFDVFLGILDVIIDRLADKIESIGRELDKISGNVFQKTTKVMNETVTLQTTLKNIGRAGDLNGKLHESLLSLSRIFSYIHLAGGRYKQHRGDSLETHTKDINSLIEYSTYVSSRVNLLLDATLGMINIAQNAIIKIFSVAAVVFLPPTLVASIYGMNFKHIPELEWIFGYPYAISTMILSSILPYLYFKKKKWL